MDKTNRQIIIWSIILLFLVFSSTYAQETGQNEGWQYSAGYGALFYQSGYGFKSSTGIEATVGKTFKQQLKWGAGLRLGLSQARPEGFIRFGIFQKFGIWKPSVAIENGITNRACFDSKTKLLKESREAMLHDIGFFYLSSHVELLSFDLKKQWNISILEIDFGTHYKNMGKTLRLQTTLLRIGKTF